MNAKDCENVEMARAAWQNARGYLEWGGAMRCTKVAVHPCSACPVLDACTEVANCGSENIYDFATQEHG